jgi:hypothetical protein
MNITGRPKSWYEYYRVTKKLICILRGYQKAGMNITGRPKVWYEILKGDQKVGMNITG